MIRCVAVCMAFASINGCVLVSCLGSGATVIDRTDSVSACSDRYRIPGSPPYDQCPPAAPQGGRIGINPAIFRGGSVDMLGQTIEEFACLK